ncbi:MAG: hypothetical protein OXL39_02480 [Caldilineaceae bacterium]|nr:hypothetical protein [Caldilineaceae bacterium]
MSSLGGTLPGSLQDAGLLLGLIISLAIGSCLIRDNVLARLAQYILVGAGLGYMAVVAWSNVLWPQLIAPFMADPASWLSAERPEDLQNRLPLLLGLVMWLGGLDLLFRPPGKWSGRRLLRLLAVIPAAILAGAGLGVGLSGALQGTFWPQLAAAVDLSQANLSAAPAGASASGQTQWLLRLLTLVITGGVLIHLRTGRSGLAGSERPASEPSTRDIVPLSTAAGPAPLARGALAKVLAAWEGVGRRALWLAAGMIFARLVAARFTLILARLEYFMFELPRSELWQLLWAAARGGGQ